MARPHDYSTLPAHPAVGTQYKKITKYGWTTPAADVTCPKCDTPRQVPLYQLRREMNRPNFHGYCRKCTCSLAREGKLRALQTRRSNGDGAKWIANNGYVMLGISAIADEDLPLFKLSLNKGGGLAEHRFVMAKALGRPLTKYECVDHMDGNKRNNDLANLRLYRKGSNNDAGNMPGHGTYYHEWQMTEKRARDLKAELDALKPSRKSQGSA